MDKHKRSAALPNLHKPAATLSLSVIAYQTSKTLYVSKGNGQTIQRPNKDGPCVTPRTKHGSSASFLHQRSHIGPRAHRCPRRAADPLPVKKKEVLIIHPPARLASYVVEANSGPGFRLPSEEPFVDSDSSPILYPKQAQHIVEYATQSDCGPTNKIHFPNVNPTLSSPERVSLKCSCYSYVPDEAGDVVKSSNAKAPNYKDLLKHQPYLKRFSEKRHRKAVLVHVRNSRPQDPRDSSGGDRPYEPAFVCLQRSHNSVPSPPKAMWLSRGRPRPSNNAMQAKSIPNIVPFNLMQARCASTFQRDQQSRSKSVGRAFIKQPRLHTQILQFTLAFMLICLFRLRLQCCLRGRYNESRFCKCRSDLRAGMKQKSNHEEQNELPGSMLLGSHGNLLSLGPSHLNKVYMNRSKFSLNMTFWSPSRKVNAFLTEF